MLYDGDTGATGNTGPNVAWCWEWGEGAWRGAHLQILDRPVGHLHFQVFHHLLHLTQREQMLLSGCDEAQRHLHPHQGLRPIPWGHSMHADPFLMMFNVLQI